MPVSLRLILGAVTLAVAATGPRPVAAQLDQETVDRWNTPHDREFDFWIGTWDVNLRVRQSDLTWRDSRASVAKIYRILGGKAILELWDETTTGNGIRGFSLRYYDRAAGEWVLWLNWPGPNRSGTSSLSGTFRHGRGEFFSESQRGDKTVISRYSFSDITPTSLRWDDAFSDDGGKTWTNSWIMEFTRTATRADWPGVGQQAHTYYTGDRCDREEFRTFERMVGDWRGTVEIAGQGTAEARVRTWPVLDGCAVISLLDYQVDGRRFEEFSFKTYNTFAAAFEDNRLDDQPGTMLRQYYGSRTEETVTLVPADGAEETRSYRWHFSVGTIGMEVSTDEGVEASATFRKASATR